MSDLLRELFYGELDFSDNLLKGDDEGQRLECIFEERQKKLLDLLPSDSANIYYAYTDASNELEDRNREAAFQRGFQLAVQLILEGKKFSNC